MKKILLVLTFLSLPIGVFSQIKSDTKKIPEEIRGCINIANNINSKLNEGQIRDGRVLIWHIENEVDLFADVEESRTGNRNERKITGWHLFDQNGREVPGTKSERRRRGRSQTIIYTNGTDPEGCFVVYER